MREETRRRDMKHSVRKEDFSRITCYLKIKPPFQSRDSDLKGYEEIAICDFNIPVPC